MSVDFHDDSDPVESLFDPETGITTQITYYLNTKRKTKKFLRYFKDGKPYGVWKEFNRFGDQWREVKHDEEGNPTRNHSWYFEYSSDTQ